jgi:hypothetical protein
MVKDLYESAVVDQPVARRHAKQAQDLFGGRAGALAEHPTGKAVHCLLLAIDGLALDNNRTQKHAQCAGMRYRAARVGRDMLVDCPLESDPFDEVIDER